jgi:hypothetical protein
MKTDKVKDSYSDDVRLALLEQSINNINNTLMRFEKRFDQIDNKIDSQFKWNLGLMAGLYAIIGSSLITFIIKFIH